LHTGQTLRNEARAETWGYQRMTDPYGPHRGPRGDPGPTPSDVLSLFDGAGQAAAATWGGDWNRYAAWLYALCLRRHVQQGDAQDVVQEVLAALAKFGGFRRAHPGAPLRPWMVRVLLNKIGDLGRDRARRPDAIPVERLEAVPGSRPIERDGAGGGELAFSDYAPVFERVRRRCTAPNNWLVFQGMLLEGKTATEVAGELGMDLARVYTAKSRTYHLFRQEIGAEAAPLRPEFDRQTWSLFLEAGVEGEAPEAVARRRGLDVLEVHRAVARVLGRLREWLRGRRRLP
jgi:DNA-directed RNA polymerase specialized sigma24 family protein